MSILSRLFLKSPATTRIILSDGRWKLPRRMFDAVVGVRVLSALQSRAHHVVQDAREKSLWVSVVLMGGLILFAVIFTHGGGGNPDPDGGDSNSGADNQAEIIQESIQHAKEAITLDVKDGYSWYNLGNACLTSFFVTGSWDQSKLQQALKAYQNAEKDERMKSNLDLYYNCATVNRYLENYERALSGFEAAATKDPSLNATEEVQKIVSLLVKLESLLKGNAKAKRLASSISLFTDVNLSTSHKKATVDLLSEGLNKAVVLMGKVIFFVKHDNAIPLYYLVCDPNQACFVLSVYGIGDDVIKEGDQLTLLEPYFRSFNFSWKGKSYKFESVRVDFFKQVLVNGKALTSQQAVCSSIHAQHKA